MQVTLNQVVVQLSSTSRVGGGGPVFSVSSTPVEAGSASLVQVSAAARAMAEVSSTGARPQLALMIQKLGSFSGGVAQSFVPFSLAVGAAERFAPPAVDAGQQARTQAAEDAVARDQRQAEAAALALQDTPAPAAAATTAPVAAYRDAAAAPAATTAPRVDARA